MNPDTIKTIEPVILSCDCLSQILIDRRSHPGGSGGILDEGCLSNICPGKTFRENVTWCLRHAARLSSLTAAFGTAIIAKKRMFRGRTRISGCPSFSAIRPRDKSNIERLRGSGPGISCYFGDARLKTTSALSGIFVGSWVLAPGDHGKILEPVAPAQPVNKAAHHQFRRHIFAADGSHVVAPAHAHANAFKPRDIAPGPKYPSAVCLSPMIFKRSCASSDSDSSTAFISSSSAK
jgi:hypothetical protein